MSIRNCMKGVMAGQCGWPNGSDGDLIINSGNVDLAAKSIKDYATVYIETGATLTITGNSKYFTFIGCKHNFTLKGSIIAKNNYLYTAGTETTNETAPDGVAVSGSIEQKTGGNGGNGARNTNGGTAAWRQYTGLGDGAGGGGGSNGEGLGGVGSDYGGGGGAGGTIGLTGGDGDRGGGSGCANLLFSGEDAHGSGGPIDLGEVGGASVGTGSGAGGDAGGNNGSSSNQGGGGGVGVQTTGGAGGAGSSDGGGGGGGGGRGYHGKNLYIRCKGIFDGSGGTIDVSGQNGYAGGNGGAASNGGGGGGGGAGGSGGKIYIRHGATAGAYTAATYTITKGTGGAGGTGGTGAGNGTSGANGNDGSTNIAAL